MSIVSIYSFMVLTLKRTSTHSYKKTAILRLFLCTFLELGRRKQYLYFASMTGCQKDIKYHSFKKTILMAGIFNCVQVIYYSFHNALESLILYKRGLVISVELSEYTDIGKHKTFMDKFFERS